MERDQMRCFMDSTGSISKLNKCLKVHFNLFKRKWCTFLRFCNMTSFASQKERFFLTFYLAFAIITF